MCDSPEPPPDSLSFALSVLAGDPCIQIGLEIYAACKDITFNNSDSSGACSLDLTLLSTWLCDGALFFTLIKTESTTLLYSHTNRVLYYATPQAQLSGACPVHTAVLCQFTVDSLAEGPTPRLLAFDVLRPRGTDPVERGEALRALAPHLPAPLCCVQWVGPRQYLTEQFVAGLPHRTAGGMVLTPDSHVLVRLLSI